MKASKHLGGLRSDSASKRSQYLMPDRGRISSGVLYLVVGLLLFK